MLAALADAGFDVTLAQARPLQRVAPDVVRLREVTDPWA